MKVSIWKVVLGLLIIALLVGGGAAIYRAGYARGVMSDMSFEEMPFAHSGAEGMMPYGGMRPGYYGRGHMGFFPFGRMLFGGFVFFLIVGSIFRFFGMRRYGYGMPPWAMHRMHREGKGGPWMHDDHPHGCKCSDDDSQEKEEAEA